MKTCGRLVGVPAAGIIVGLFVFSVAGGWGCRQSAVTEPGVPPELAKADGARGGGLYDKFWAIAGVEAPKTDHPLWASRPDKGSNKRKGPDTWRCKECHGWDYKGIEGAYRSGSHKTGFAGIFGTKLSAREVFSLLKEPSGPGEKASGHHYGSVLGDGDLWDLTKFVLEGQIVTETMIDGSGKFTGDAPKGAKWYRSGVGTLAACEKCHGEDGLKVPKGAPETYSAWVGKMAKANPWEVQHKVRFGQPKTPMVAWFGTEFSARDMADLGAFAQTLPTEPAK